MVLERCCVSWKLCICVGTHGWMELHMEQSSVGSSRWSGIFLARLVLRFAPPLLPLRSRLFFCSLGAIAPHSILYLFVYSTWSLSGKPLRSIAPYAFMSFRYAPVHFFILPLRSRRFGSKLPHVSEASFLITSLSLLGHTSFACLAYIRMHSFRIPRTKSWVFHCNRTS